MEEFSGMVKLHASGWGNNFWNILSIVKIEILCGRKLAKQAVTLDRTRPPPQVVFFFLAGNLVLPVVSLRLQSWGWIQPLQASMHPHSGPANSWVNANIQSSQPLPCIQASTPALLCFFYCRITPRFLSSPLFSIRLASSPVSVNLNIFSDLHSSHVSFLHVPHHFVFCLPSLTPSFLSAPILSSFYASHSPFLVSTSIILVCLMSCKPGWDTQKPHLNGVNCSEAWNFLRPWLRDSYHQMSVQW